MQWVHRPIPGQPQFFRNAALEYLTKTPWWDAYMRYIQDFVTVDVLQVCLLTDVLTISNVQVGGASNLGANYFGVLEMGCIGYSLVAKAIGTRCSWSPAVATPGVLYTQASNKCFPAANLVLVVTRRHVDLAKSPLASTVFCCRNIFHAHPHSYWAITFHFGFHGCHHKYPRDRERLVFPPLPAFLIAFAIHRLLALVLPQVCDLSSIRAVSFGIVSWTVTADPIDIHWSAGGAVRYFLLSS